LLVVGVHGASCLPLFGAQADDVDEDAVRAQERKILGFALFIEGVALFQIRDRCRGDDACDRLGAVATI